MVYESPLFLMLSKVFNLLLLLTRYWAAPTTPYRYKGGGEDFVRPPTPQELSPQAHFVRDNPLRGHYNETLAPTQELRPCS